jgi:hypothetical protein
MYDKLLHGKTNVTGCLFRDPLIVTLIYAIPAIGLKVNALHLPLLSNGLRQEDRNTHRFLELQ